MYMSLLIIYELQRALARTGRVPQRLLDPALLRAGDARIAAFANKCGKLTGELVSAPVARMILRQFARR